MPFGLRPGGKNIFVRSSLSRRGGENTFVRSSFSRRGGQNTFVRSSLLRWGTKIQMFVARLCVLATKIHLFGRRFRAGCDITEGMTLSVMFAALLLPHGGETQVLLYDVFHLHRIDTGVSTKNAGRFACPDVFSVKTLTEVFLLFLPVARD